MISNKDIKNLGYKTYTPSDFTHNIFSIKYQLEENGIIFVEKIFSNSDAIYIANQLGVIFSNIDADIHGITEISNKRTGNNKKNSAAFTTQGLCPHTDRSPLETPPNLLMNWTCMKGRSGGEALLVDGYEVFNHMKLNQKDIIDIFTHPDVACFTDGIDTFTGPIFHIDDNNVLRIKFRYDSCSFFKLEAKESIKIFLNIIEQFTHTIDFDLGCGYIIRNDRWLHGRKPFHGHRITRRIHITERF